MRYRTRIDELRRKLAVDQNQDINYSDIAAATGLHYMTVHRYATKEIAEPPYNTLARIARFFNVPVDELVIELDEDEQGQEVAVAVT